MGPPDQLFRDCANGLADDNAFYQQIEQLWAVSRGNRSQGFGWERKGQTLARAFVAILCAVPREHDDVDLPRKLRAALLADPRYAAKNLAELDNLIWASAKK